MYTLPDVFTERLTSGQDVDHGIQFQDVNGDGLIDMMQGYACDPCPGSPGYNCVYLNTGIAWVLQTGTSHATRDCAADAALLVRNTSMTFKKQTVGQLREAVAAEFGLDVASVSVRCKQGINQGRTKQISDLFPLGFELTIAGGEDAEIYSCP